MPQTARASARRTQRLESVEMYLALFYAAQKKRGQTHSELVLLHGLLVRCRSASERTLEVVETALLLGFIGCSMDADDVKCGQKVKGAAARGARELSRVRDERRERARARAHELHASHPIWSPWAVSQQVAKEFGVSGRTVQRYIAGIYG